MFNDDNPEKFKVKSIEDIKNENRRNKKVRQIQSKKRVLGLFIILCMSVLIIAGFKLCKRCLVLSVNENKIGIVESNSDLIRIKEELRKQIVKEIEVEDIEFNELVSTTKEKYDKTLISSDDKIFQGLKENLTYKIKAFIVMVDGKETAILENKEQTNRILNKMKDEYNVEAPYIMFTDNMDMIKDYFFGNVKLSFRFVDKKDIMSDEQAINYLSTIEEVTKYTVKSNDTLWTIAESNNITIEEILLANEGFVENEVLRVGQEINLVLPLPLLSVISYKEQSYETVIEPQVEMILRDDKYEDYKNVIEEGKAGKKRVTVKIKMVNTTEMSQEIIREDIVEESEKQVIEVGSKELPTNAKGIGLFMMPTRGTFTGGFWEYRDGYYHKGVDIANALGTSIYASYTGTVTVSEYSNSFGYYIKIKHSSGYETLYAHLSELLVEVGDKVSKGDLIGKMGSTGNSTGSHLHFELHKDGGFLNPMSYIN